MRPFPRFLRAAVLTLTAALLLWVAAHLLYAAFCAFTAGKFQYIDYGRYTQAVWNSGHGALLRVGAADGSYLASHLSFSLILLGPLFRLWDHPLLLTVVQWLCALAGAAICFRQARRTGVPAELACALALLLLGSSFSQAVLLSEFHGTALYFVLLPWLYVRLAARAPDAWLPLLLLCGVREDAALVALPMLLLFAWRLRWRGGALMALAAAGYALLACQWLFPLLAGRSLAARRPGVRPDAVLGSLRQLLTGRRGLVLGWLFLPALPLLPWGWRAILIFPSAATLIGVLGSSTHQYRFENHYAAATLVMLTLGMLDAARSLAAPSPVALLRRIPWLNRPMGQPWPALAVTLALLTVLLIQHRHGGFLPLGRHHAPPYLHPAPRGLQTLRVGHQIPRDGLLLCNRPLAGFVSNRARLLLWRQPDLAAYHPDVVFSRRDCLAGGERALLRACATNATYGVSFFDGLHIVLRRGWPTNENAAVAACFQPPAMTNSAPTRFPNP